MNTHIVFLHVKPYAGNTNEIKVYQYAVPGYGMEDALRNALARACGLEGYVVRAEIITI